MGLCELAFESLVRLTGREHSKVSFASLFARPALLIRPLPLTTLRRDLRPRRAILLLQSTIFERRGLRRCLDTKVRRVGRSRAARIGRDHVTAFDSQPL